MSITMEQMHEIGTEMIRERRVDGFNSALRELCIKHGDDADLISVAEEMTRARVVGYKPCNRVPDGWLIGKLPSQGWVVAVLEVDDTHSDIHKWEPLASAFDASEHTTFVEYRRHRNGPLVAMTEGEICMQSAGYTLTPRHVLSRPWLGAIMQWRGRKKKVSIQDLVAHMIAVEWA